MAIWFLTVWLLSSAPGELINQVVAVVEGAPITLWEIRVEARLRAYERRGEPPAEDPGLHEQIEALEKLITRKLTVQAAERFRIPHPAPSAVDKAFDELAARQGEELGMAIGVTDGTRFRAWLRAQGISESVVRDRIRAQMMIDDLIFQRLRDLVQVSENDVRAYMEEHREEVRRYQAANPTAPTERLVREYLVTRRLRERTQSFLQGLQERAKIAILDRRFASALPQRPEAETTAPLRP